MRPRTGAAALAGLPLLLIAACSDPAPDTAPSTGVPASITVTSPDLVDGGTVPVRFTCDGAGTSPALAWTGVPDNAAALALVVDDPDAPSGTFTHWVVLDIPTATTSVADDSAPVGCVEADNSAGDAAYTGPCPPSGTHHYRFTVYALSAPTRLAAGVDLDDALAAVTDTAIASGRLTATYAHRAG